MTTFQIGDRVQGGKGADHTADPDQPGGFLPAAPMEKPLPAL